MKHCTIVIFAWIFAANAVFAEAFERVSLDPVTHNDASLVVVGSDGNLNEYSPADLEALPTYSVTTTTPWRDEPAEFVGVLLSDLLAIHGLADAAEILVTAENDYATTIGRDLLEDVQILVATRVDGRPHTRRERGPIQFVIEQQQFDTSVLTSESNFVWMAARIEIAE